MPYSVDLNSKLNVWINISVTQTDINSSVWNLYSLCSMWHKIKVLGTDYGK